MQNTHLWWCLLPSWFLYSTVLNWFVDLSLEIVKCQNRIVWILEKLHLYAQVNNAFTNSLTMLFWLGLTTIPSPPGFYTSILESWERHGCSLMEFSGVLAGHLWCSASPSSRVSVLFLRQYARKATWQKKSYPELFQKMYIWVNRTIPSISMTHRIR